MRTLSPAPSNGLISSDDWLGTIGDNGRIIGPGGSCVTSSLTQTLPKQIVSSYQEVGVI